MSEMSDLKNYQWRKMAKNGEKGRKMAMANLPFSFVKFAISPLAPPRYSLQVAALKIVVEKRVKIMKKPISRAVLRTVL